MATLKDLEGADIPRPEKSTSIGWALLDLITNPWLDGIEQQIDYWLIAWGAEDEDIETLLGMREYLREKEKKSNV